MLELWHAADDLYKKDAVQCDTLDMLTIAAHAANLAVYKDYPTSLYGMQRPDGDLYFKYDNGTYEVIKKVATIDNVPLYIHVEHVGNIHGASRVYAALYVEFLKNKATWYPTIYDNSDYSI